MKPSLVSIIIPTYNRQDHIRKAIESCLEQEYGNKEIIVVDDGSTDGTRVALQPYIESQGIKYIYQENRGPAAARNKGIEKSQGEYIAILDSDDSWQDKKKLEKQVKFLRENPDYVLVGGGVIVKNKEGREMGRYLLPEKDREIRGFILLNNPFAHSTVLFRRRDWEKAGGYDENFDFYEDWDLWLKFGKLGKFYNFQQYFVYYLAGEQNRTNYYNVGRHLKTNIDFRKRYSQVYPHFKKALLLCLAHFFYSFLPLRKKHHPLIYKIRVKVFGPPAFRYSQK